MSVVSLTEAKTHLNMESATAEKETELASFVARAEAAIVARMRELEPTAATARVDGGGRRGLTLPTGQAIASVQSVTTVGGVSLDMADLFVKESSGVIEYDDGRSFTARAYDVAYTAGFLVTPEDLRLAVLELVRHLWDTQRAGGSRRVGSGGSDSAANTLPGAAHTLPFRVVELLHPWIGVPNA